jgi:uncharacterized protein YukE
MARTTHTIKTRVLTEGSLQGMTVDKVGQLLQATDPGKVMDAGAEYQALAKRLDTTVRELEKQARALAEVWHGDAAVKAQEALRKLHATARELRAKSNQMGGSLATLGKQMDWYRVHAPGYGNASVDDSVKGAVGLDNADDDAKAHLRNLNSRMREAHGTMPASLTEDLPGLSDATTDRPPPPRRRDPGGIDPYGKDPFGKNPYDTKDPYGNDPFENDPSTKDPYGNDPYDHDPYGNGPSGGGRDPFGRGGTELASAGGGLGGGGGGLGTGGGLGGGGGGVGGGPGSGLGSAGGLAGGPLGVGGTGTGGGLGSGAKSGAAGRPGGTPLGAGGGGKEGEKERERSTWLTEDEDVWGDDGDVAPPVIG